MIEVPHWWDMRTESLAATIHKVRSDPITNPPEVDPIPLSNPLETAENDSSIPLSHGQPWDGIQDLTGW